MKYPVKKFKSLKDGLKELEPFIRDGEHIQTGRPFKAFQGMRSREVLTNWLLCAVVNYDHSTDELTFTTDPLGGDGIIYNSRTEQAVPTEHVMVPKAASDETVDIKDKFLEKIKAKHEKGGAAYASGKSLVVFLNAAGGPWRPNEVARALPEPLYFTEVWVVSLEPVKEGEYAYIVAKLDVSSGNAPAWRVRIAKDFDAWTVERIQ